MACGKILTGRSWQRALGTSRALRSPQRRWIAIPAPTATEAAALPLSGIKVLDMTRILAGPYSTQILADLGAQVTKIEHPLKGDDTRAWGPPYADYKTNVEAMTEKAGGRQGESAYYLTANRNKKSMGLNFQTPEGQAILHKLVADSDVLVENYLPNTLARYGMDYKTVSKINPRLVYASITGYGQTGPYSARAGYDVMVEAEMGLMHITGERDGPPVKVGVAVTDLTTGLYTSGAIMAALLGRVTTGRGQHIDMSLSDCQVATLANIASSVLISGEPDQGRWGTSHPSIVPYKGFKTSDGDVMMGTGNEKLYATMCERLGKPEWIKDPRFINNSTRVAHRDELEGMIEEITKTKTTAEWLEILEGSGMPYAAINDVKKTMEHPHVIARNMIKEVEHPVCGTIKMVNTPFKFSESTPGIRSAPPTLGQHTDEVLEEMCGMSRSEIEELKSKKIVA